MTRAPKVSLAFGLSQVDPCGIEIPTVTGALASINPRRNASIRKFGWEWDETYPWLIVQMIVPP